MYHGRFVCEEIKLFFTMISWPFMAFLLFCCDFIGQLFHKTPIRQVELFAQFFFCSFYAVNPFLREIMKEIQQKNHHLLFSKHFHRGRFNFHDIFVLSTTVDLFRNIFTSNQLFVKTKKRLHQ